jgi:thiol-disulfide isomerase/thioredoxin
MKPVHARWVAGVALVVLALAGARAVRHFHHHVLHTGDRLVPIQLSSLYGAPYTLAGSRRPTVINVFATWCTPCREETPGFAAAAGGLRARGFDVVGIDQEESAAAVSAFAREFALPYPVYIDTSGVTHDLLGARVIPTTIVVNADGVIVWEHAGPLQREDFLRAAATIAETPG